MNFRFPWFLFAGLTMLSACTVEPQPIEFGRDACNFCKMNIVDKLHAAEFVTQKGKVYKFDAIECMMNRMKDFDIDGIAIYLVSDYSAPGELTDAVTATYVRTESISSPMGKFLTAFSQKTEAERILQDAEGELYDWDQLKLRFGL